MQRTAKVPGPAQDALDPIPVSTNGTPKRGHSNAPPTAAALFASLWDALADLLGTSAAAVLLRRAARHATGRSPELAEITIVREGLEYRYTLPRVWHERAGEPHLALRQLVAELLPLLANLTGSLALRHLAQVGDLREQGIIPRQEES